MAIRISLACSLMAAFAAAAVPAMADGAVAAYLAGTCSTCHHPSDKSAAMPALAGRDATELIATLQAYRTGARQDAVMHAVAGSLTDAETAEVAAYFAHQEPAQ
jgi:cytochrome c553